MSHNYEYYPPVGIDLGTTYSAISKWDGDNNCSVVYNMANESVSVLKSVVYLEKLDNEENFVVGKNAAKLGVMYPDNVCAEVKRKMDDENNIIELAGKKFSPIDISAEILIALLTAPLKESAGNFNPEGIVVSVPYYFKVNQCSNTKKALEKAIEKCYADKASKPKVVGVVPEPVAAALCYTLENQAEIMDKTILVFDLGGGTLDLSLFKVSQNNTKVIFEVKATDGSSRLGGLDFDESFRKYICAEAKIDDKDLFDLKNSKSKSELYEIVNDAKHTLTTAKSYQIIVDNLTREGYLDQKVFRDDFNSCLKGEAGDFRNFIQEIETLVEKTLGKADLYENGVDRVLLVGGSTKVPIVKELLEDIFGENKVFLPSDVDLAVTKGAAIYCAAILDQDRIKNGEKAIHLQGLCDNKKISEIEIKEIMSHPVGIKDAYGNFQEMINDNTITPFSKTKEFRPTTDKGFMIQVYQGSQKKAEHNTLVGNINVPAFSLHDRGMGDVKIEITLTAIRNLINVKILIDKGNADRSDLEILEELQMA